MLLVNYLIISEYKYMFAFFNLNSNTLLKTALLLRMFHLNVIFLLKFAIYKKNRERSKEYPI